MSVAAMGADMTGSWKEWEGRTVDRKFRLESYLGGADASGVFRTEIDGTPAAIRILAIDSPDIGKQLRRWKDTGELSLSHLVRILAIGRAGAADAEDLVYVVEEYAEENLGQIIPERALTSDETRGMLKPVLAGLEYLHSKGFVHGELRPSHIFAVGDQVKLSSDALLRPGEVPRSDSALDAPELAASGASPASDVWSLGMTLVEVMTRHVPSWDAARLAQPAVSEDVPEPFRTIAQRCLQIDPAKRCGIGEIRERLEPGAVVEKIRKAVPRIPAEPEEKSSPKWPYALGLLAAIVIVAFLFHTRSTESNHSETAAPAATQNAPAESSSPQAPQQSSTQPSSRPSPLAAKPPDSGNAAQPPTPKDDVVERAAPEVSASARRTIHGRIKVRVKVNVDADGNVTSASLKDVGPSKYFARVAEEAAKRWKFTPAHEGQAEARSWTVLFVFSRAGTEMSAAQAR